VLKGRLVAYRAQTAPLANHYAGKGMLKTVDGMAPIDTVTAAIAQILSSGGGGTGQTAPKTGRDSTNRVSGGG